MRNEAHDIGTAVNVNAPNMSAFMVECEEGMFFLSVHPAEHYSQQQSCVPGVHTWVYVCVLLCQVIDSVISRPILVTFYFSHDYRRGNHLSK